MRLRQLPASSACHRAMGGPGWELIHYELAHLFHATSGKPYPALPTPQRAVDPERMSKLAAANRRARQRAQDIAEGRIT